MTGRVQILLKIKFTVHIQGMINLIILPKPVSPLCFESVTKSRTVLSTKVEIYVCLYLLESLSIDRVYVMIKL